MQAMQSTFRKIYTHHVTKTYSEEHRLKGEALDDEIRAAWDVCSIPADQTKFHPHHTDVEVLLGQTYNVRRLWVDLQTAYQGHEAPVGEPTNDNG